MKQRLVKLPVTSGYTRHLSRDENRYDGPNRHRGNETKQSKLVAIAMSMLLVLFALLAAFNAQARVEAHDFASEQQEQDYNQLIDELRCLVCQNQNLADSNAELAQDMRTKVFAMLNEGKSKEEIIDYMVARYGDFVMYRPPVKSSTYFLWFGPLIFFVVAGFIVASYLRRQKTEDKPVIDQQQQQKAHSLLDDDQA